MKETKYYCDKCKKQITNFNETKEYTVRWDSEYFNHFNVFIIQKKNMTEVEFHKKNGIRFVINILNQNGKF